MLAKKFNIFSSLTTIIIIENDLLQYPFIFCIFLYAIKKGT